MSDILKDIESYSGDRLTVPNVVNILRTLLKDKRRLQLQLLPKPFSYIKKFMFHIKFFLM